MASIVAFQAIDTGSTPVMDFYMKNRHLLEKIIERNFEKWINDLATLKIQIMILASLVSWLGSSGRLKIYVRVGSTPTQGIWGYSSVGLVVNQARGKTTIRLFGVIGNTND